jgi:glycogen debranching enzyme
MGRRTQIVDDELVHLHDQFYIQATSSRADDRTRVLKHGDTFAVFDRFGDVQPVGLGEQGIYHQGTRFLSGLELRVGGRRPLLLSSTVKQENDLLTVDMANPDLKNEAGQIVLPRGTLHVLRSKFLWRAGCYERLRISNFGLEDVDTEVTLDFVADYADIFEVRGSKREKTGRRLEPVLEKGAATLAYEGLDHVMRRTRITFDPKPDELTGRQAFFSMALKPHETRTVLISFGCETSDATTGEESRPETVNNDKAFSALQDELGAGYLTPCRVHATETDLDEWISRSASDLMMMISQTRHGPYPFAGVPWFSTPFGRDGIITALELLWVAPDVARGVLSFLAATQATELVPARDAEPGKILHEAREGEMAALLEVPFGRYYGSVDSTPLYVMLVAAYYRRTGDMTFLRTLAPHVDRALRWIEDYGDVDGDGFVEYARRTPTGLIQQGWKDSHDSVFHDDGKLADAPIALCEVQGYVYAAWHAAAEIATALGEPERAEAAKRKATALRERFAEHFWDGKLGTYVLALDGDKRPCRVRSSNAGHALLTGIALPEHAPKVVETLMREQSFSGWGIRTLDQAERRYNPMSYHNGSVWPHDNALVAAGFARYGFADEAARVFEAQLAASRFVDLRRLPELFCGFPRRPGEGPTLYPVACAPQAWASAAVYMLLGSVLGLTVDGVRGEITFARPRLPKSLTRLRITGLATAAGRVDLLLENLPHDVGLTVLKREGDVRIVVVK